MTMSSDFTEETAIALDRIANAIALYARVQAAVALVSSSRFQASYGAYEFLKTIGEDRT